MSPFSITTIGTTVTCLACGARIGNTIADRVEHLTTPSRAKAASRTKKPTTTKTGPS